ncbi:hypothetical protein [Xylophilus sp. GOD-11R]|uniref:hypothetical protein n=1 Tax=Xylophilus sp. GOD-11R TaxID=3089814 RepID=UPI00298C10A2|nr:hypothetical protein [Xylophilus sp. GOD-11R]WPB58246.1 hypothetical protein R9X41_06285 [Xylophilus sp. GOD-11R]
MLLEYPWNIECAYRALAAEAWTACTALKSLNIEAKALMENVRLFGSHPLGRKRASDLPVLFAVGCHFGDADRRWPMQFKVPTES